MIFYEMSAFKQQLSRERATKIERVKAPSCNIVYNGINVIH